MIRMAVMLSLLASQLSPAAAGASDLKADWIVEIARYRMARAERMVAPPVLIPGPVERVVRPSAFEAEIKSALQPAMNGGQPIDLRDLSIYASPDFGHLVVCGEANARNIYGAITHFDRFALVMADPETGVAPGAAAAYGQRWIEPACGALEKDPVPAA